MRPHLVRAAILLALALGPASVAASATMPPAAPSPPPAGAITGVVRNGGTREPLPGALVSLPALHRAVSTDSAGRYELRGIPAGEQQLVIRHLGFAEFSLRALVAGGAPLDLEVALRPQPIPLAVIEVRAPMALPGTERTAAPCPESARPIAVFPDRSLDLTQVRNNPLLAEPDVFQVFSGGDVTIPLESPSGVHIHGGESDQTAYLLDGVPVFSPYHSSGVFSAWNPDALARVDLRTVDPVEGGLHALSGTISAETRAPGPRRTSQWSLGSSQARFTTDGPIGARGAGFVLGVRSDLPALLAPGHDPTYVTGRTGDGLAKFETPLFSGRLRLLGYRSANRLSAAASLADSQGAALSGERNAFDWGSVSVGAEWSGAFAGGTLRGRGWHAAADAGSSWRATHGRLELDSRRRDDGFAATFTRGAADRALEVGARLELTQTTYRVAADTARGSGTDLSSRLPLATLFASRRATRGAFDAMVGGSLATTGANSYAAPHARVSWRAAPPVRLTGSYARTHQFAQSLRNGESVAGGLFPADLYLGAGARDVPVARSDLGVLALEFLPSPGFSLAAQAYVRRSTGLVLVAPEEGAPFATGAFAVGRGASEGASLDATWTTRSLGLVAGYTWQQVRYETGTTRYTPDHGAGHLVQGGLLLTPNHSTSLRLGVTGALGRRATGIANGFEWESCNLLDRGCEFAGSPDHGGAAPGAVRLPGYVRIDLGVRKSWRIRVGRQETSLALFGTVSNLLNRRNILTYAQTTDGTGTGVGMRPLAPLTVGLEGRF